MYEYKYTRKEDEILISFSFSQKKIFNFQRKNKYIGNSVLLSRQNIIVYFLIVYIMIKHLL